MDFDAVDANRDGVIDRAEWNAAAAVSGSRSPLLSMDSSLMLSEVGPASPTGPTSPQAIKKALELAQSRHQELEDLLEVPPEAVWLAEALCRRPTIGTRGRPRCTKPWSGWRRSDAVAAAAAAGV